MLERYTKHPLGFLWTEQHRLDTWARVEIAAAEAKGAPPGVLYELWDTPVPDLEEVEAEEIRTRHDVVAFLNVWRRHMDAETAGWVHKGMTSSDLVDTANAVRLDKIMVEIAARTNDLVYVTAAHALKHWATPRLARTHGQAAEASTWGYRVADFSCALQRSHQALIAARRSVRYAKLSGPVGNYRHTTHAQEVAFADLLDLDPADVATQVVMRDGLSDAIYACARVASVIEALALEIRIGAQFGIEELAEGFAPGQAGSSAMPHKQNPITAEQLCGLAKVVRAQLVPILEGVALWSERDISHSSVERIAVQTATVVTHYMIVTATRLVSDLVVRDEVMLANLDSAGDATLSAWIKDLLIESGLHPEVAWSVVQEAASIPTLPDLVEAVNQVLRQRGIDLQNGYPPPQPQPDVAHVRARLAAIVKSYHGVLK